MGLLPVVATRPVPKLLRVVVFSTLVKLADQAKLYIIFE